MLRYNQPFFKNSTKSNFFLCFCEEKVGFRAYLIISIFFFHFILIIYIRKVQIQNNILLKYINISFCIKIIYIYIYFLKFLFLIFYLSFIFHFIFIIYIH